MSRLVGTSHRTLGATVMAVGLFLAACGGASDSAGDQSTDESVVASDGVPSESVPVTSASPESSAPTSESSDEPSPAATIVSSDGILTVEVPEGAAPAGTEVSIEKLDENSLPEQLQVPDVAIAGYDLLPDGTVFTEPVTITYRIDPSEFDIDLPEGAVPLGLLVTENEAGELETLDVELSRDDEMFVARAEVTHFSPFAIMISGTRALVLRPEALALPVDGEANVSVSYATLVDEELSFKPVLFLGESWSATAPFDATRKDFNLAVVSCSKPTDAVVDDAYVLTLERVTAAQDGDEDLERLFADTLGLGATSFEVVYRLGGDGTCSVDGTDPTGDPFSSSGLSSTDNPKGMATDITKVTYGSGGPASLRRSSLGVTHEFTVTLAGDGEGVATDPETSFYLVDVRVAGADGGPEGGFDASIGYYDGVLEPGAVVSRSVDNGEYTTTRLPGASVEIEWVNADEFVVTVFNIEGGQVVEGFVVATSTRAFSDEATCHARCVTE